MHQVTDEQVEFIRSDLAERGITLESLREDLIDHICCILETKYDGGDFNELYLRVLSGFYVTTLSEIEQETILHLKYKNLYPMKKTMIYSGGFTSVTLVLGCIFKVMHWPGAVMFFVLAILTGSFVF